MVQKKKAESKRPIESYEHRDKERVNNPPVGLVTPETDPDAGQKKKTYAYYDPHLGFFTDLGWQLYCQEANLWRKELCLKGLFNPMIF